MGSFGDAGATLQEELLQNFHDAGVYDFATELGLISTTDHPTLQLGAPAVVERRAGTGVRLAAPCGGVCARRGRGVRRRADPTSRAPRC